MSLLLIYRKTFFLFILQLKTLLMVQRQICLQKKNLNDQSNFHQINHSFDSAAFRENIVLGCFFGFFNLSCCFRILFGSMRNWIQYYLCRRKLPVLEYFPEKIVCYRGLHTSQLLL
ncbi:hypothetical protein T07_10221 [Trichinella nelsoni]|uniref:Uncharacterized protein n=1 Tax=Trichinella nelsoni TaxID=6336 RepID=A0A0V0RWJ4_9BILA|nr:hypothetical protein T07_10221 [Trichinella nelsoni]